jgi:hypothetical protein
MQASQIEEVYGHFWEEDSPYVFVHSESGDEEEKELRVFFLQWLVYNFYVHDTVQADAVDSEVQREVKEYEENRANKNLRTMPVFRNAMQVRKWVDEKHPHWVTSWDGVQKPVVNKFPQQHTINSVGDNSGSPSKKQAETSQLSISEQFELALTQPPDGTAPEKKFVIWP